MIEIFGDQLTDRRIELEKKGNPQFKYLRWLLTACSVDETRAVLNCICVEGDTMIASNGRVLHRCAKLRDLDDGIWWPEVLQSGKVVLRQVDTNFPNYKQVIPDDEAKGRFKHSSEFIWDREGSWMVKHGIVLDTGMLKNILWGGDVLKKDDKARCDTYIEPEQKNPHSTSATPGPVTFHFRDWSRFAVLMPIRAGR